ncbi:MAG: hypothetical protein RR614_16215, partial [Eubacterium sp.]
EAGNKSEVAKQSFKKTSTATDADLIPTITLAGTEVAGKPTLYQGTVTATITAPAINADTQNPLDRLEYQFVEAGSTINDTNWKTCRDGDVLSYSNTTGTLYARAVDIAGKTTLAAKYAQSAFIADSRVPVVSITAPAGVSESNWTAGPVTLKVEGGTKDRDGNTVVSGVKKIEYKIDSGNWFDLPADGTLEVNTTGKQTITV